MVTTRKPSRLVRQPILTPSKSETIYTHLRELAFRRGPEAKLPTVKELCESLGTSQVTINDVLGVLEAHNIIYRKKGSGIYVSSTINRKTICVLLDSNYFETPGSSPFWNTLFGMFVKEAELRGTLRDVAYEFHIARAGGQHESYLQTGLVKAIENGRVHGVVMIGSDLHDPVFDSLHEKNIPIVSFAASGKWTIALDMTELIRLGVDALHDQGCRRIGYWKSVSPYSRSKPHADTDEDRQFQKSIENHGMVFDPASIVTGVDFLDEGEKIGSHQEQGYALAMRMFGDKTGDSLDGIVIKDDMMTSGAIAAAYRVGVRLGDDIRIASHANTGSTVLFGFDQFLTLIEFSPEEIVRALCDMAEALVDGKTPREAKTRIKPMIRRTA